MNSTLLVVAHNSEARFFSMESRAGAIIEMKDFVDVQARLHQQDMTSDSPGRIRYEDGEGSHTYQTKISPKEQENIGFAGRIATELDRVRKENKFKQFVLVAAPAFLGRLRDQMNEQTRQMVSFELAKNLSHLDAIEIRKHLPERLPGL